MPQITSCPECSKKLRVPDDLIGKKVKCPGCTTMFVAETDDPEEEAPPPPPKKAPPKAAPERPRSDAVTSSPRRKSRDEEEEEEEAPRSRGRARDEEDEEEAPRSRGRARDDDEEEDRPSRRRGRDEDDEDDRPSRRRGRGDDDDDEDRPSRRRRSELSAEDKAMGWDKARIGMNLVAIAGWLSLSLIGLGLLFGGMMLLLGGDAVASFGGGNFGGAANSAGGMYVMGCGFAVLFGLISLASFGLFMVGTGFCLATPKLSGQSMKGMAMTAFFLFVGAVVVYLFGVVISSVSLSAFFMSFLIMIAAWLTFGAGWIVWMVYLRQACLYFRDTGLASTVMTCLIYQIVVPVVFLIIMFLLGLLLRYTGAAGAIVMMILYFLFYVGMIGISIWVVLTIQQVRDLVAAKAG